MIAAIAAMMLGYVRDCFSFIPCAYRFVFPLLAVRLLIMF
jgi:hypothetical protein